MSKSTYPSMGVSGWTSDPAEIAINVFTDTFVADFSQTLQFLNHGITSVGYCIHLGGDNVEKFVEEYELAIARVFKKYFDDVEVEVTDVDGDLTRAIISLYVRYSYNGVRHTLSKDVRIEDRIALEDNYDT